MNVPFCPRASSQLNSAVRTLPTCRWPVGLGANRTRMRTQLQAPGCRLGPATRRRAPRSLRCGRARPTFSFVLPLTLTAEMSMPIAVARFARIAWTCGSNFGRSAITTASTFDDRVSGRRGRSRRRFAATRCCSAPFHFGSVSGKCWPISPCAAAPRIASVTAWHSTSASECPSEPRVVRNLDAADDERPARFEPVKIVAGADPH